MKQIRRGVFETNSSSTHSITMCLKSDYDRWVKGEILLFKGSGWSFEEGYKPQKNNFYTRAEAIEFMKHDKYCSNDTNWDDNDAVDEILRENEFVDSDYENDELEWYEETYITPSGEEVIAFGEYGYQG
ncbi:MAG: hypothetical protein K0R54_5452 [Clostridiaceae bacterium]|jgi:hypothetical protein|nr:hypothetical protein [Clostridiaceae bacterium]MDF2950504.1 hypothetical protein [Anaerocolumna sp.]